MEQPLRLFHRCGKKLLCALGPSPPSKANTDAFKISVFIRDRKNTELFNQESSVFSNWTNSLYAALCHTLNFLLSCMKIITPVSTMFEGARSSKCQQPKIRLVSLRFGAMSAGLKNGYYGGSTIGNRYIATSMTMAPAFQGRNELVQGWMAVTTPNRMSSLATCKRSGSLAGSTSFWLQVSLGLLRKRATRVLSTLELHVSALIGTASHPDMQKIRITGFFLEKRLHCQS